MLGFKGPPIGKGPVYGESNGHVTNHAT